MKGEKSTFVSVNSMFDITHSYTIIPLISMSGKFVGKIFITFQEYSGVFGPRVLDSLKQYPNIYYDCSKSGKMTSANIKNW